MKNLFQTLALAGLAAISSFQSAGQANDWVFPPNKRIHYTTSLGFASDFPGTSGINGCGAGSGYLWDQYAGAITDASGNGMVIVHGCGAYDPQTGASIGSVTSPYTFAVPGICNRYYSLSWDFVNGPPHYMQLTLRQIDASNPAAISVVSSSAIATGNSGLSIAPGPLASDGSRKVFFSDEGGLRYISIAANGTVSGVTTMQTFTTPNQVQPEPGMEVSPDGKKVVVCMLGGNVKLLDVASNTFTAIGPFTSSTIVAGIEYVPFNGAGGDRVYFSYHSHPMTPSAFEGLGYVSLNAPTVLNDALPSLPANMAKSGFGFTEIERAKNGYLHFAYHNNYASHWVLTGDVGALYWIYPPVAGSFGAVANNTTTSAVDQGTGYIIQKQIDGEDYRSFTLSPPSFSVNGHFQSGVAIPDVLLCDNDQVRIFTSESGYYSGYGVTIQKGTVAGNIFTPVGGGISISILPGSKALDTINLQTLFGGDLDSSYSGGLRVTYTVYNGCGSQSFTQTVNLIRATTLARYYAPKYISAFAKGTKLLQKTLPITTPMPSNSNLIAFKVAIGNAVGWMGASSAGADSITTNGEYDLRVYEVMWKVDTTFVGGNMVLDSSIVRRVYVDSLNVRDTAPDICYYRDTVAVFDVDIAFNATTLKFSAGSSRHFFYDTTYTNQDWFNWFSDYYTWAQGHGQLTDFSSRNYCVEFTVKTPLGCTVVNKSYFRIANNGLPNGAGARPGGTSIGELPEEQELLVYPNPASTVLMMSWEGKARLSSKVTIVNVLGSTVLERQVTESQGANTLNIDISKLTPGIYYYSKTTATGVQKGSFVKE